MNPRPTIPGLFDLRSPPKSTILFHHKALVEVWLVLYFICFVCHGVCVEVIEPLAGVGSLLPSCGSLDQTLVVSLGNYSAICAERSLTFVPILGPG